MLWIWKIQQQVDSTVRADHLILHALSAKLGEWSGLQECQPTLSRSRLQKLIEKGHVKANQKPIRANTKLKKDDLIEIQIPAPEPTELIPEEKPLEILYEDEYLLVLNKPPGLTVHPSETQKTNTLVHALLYRIKDLSGIGGELRPGIVHRLDKNTSGALVVTKTDAAHIKLADTFARHSLERSYWALCYGAPPKNKFDVESTIGRNPSDRKKMIMNVKGGRRAVTKFELLEKYVDNKEKAFASMIMATLETGRTHQVRVHLTGSGHSVLGDPIYGEPSSKNPKWLALPDDVKEAVAALPGQALHARVLGFEHPITGKKLRFEAEPPPAFANLLRVLRQYLKGQ